ncbi:hypothetical protein NXF25_002116 [Crotalus adamanteus]|uniref:Uncharacterized protein n=1 Tax=Crotalus adamanteus TaxID=8729 RepID=A0AAW1C8Y4_CROAD
MFIVFMGHPGELYLIGGWGRPKALAQRTTPVPMGQQKEQTQWWSATSVAMSHFSKRTGWISYHLPKWPIIILSITVLDIPHLR